MDQESQRVNPFEEKAIFDYADKFIELANELVQSDNSGKVGVALRYAAARYSAFEASLQAQSLDEEMDTLREAFANDFETMLQINFEDYQKRLNK